jgi:hypothetical protein
MAIFKKTFKLEIRLESLGVGEKGELELKELIKEYIEELKIDLSNNQGTFLKFIHDTSLQYNLDKMSIVYKYLNHLIYNFPNITDSSFLKSIEIILHRQDIPIEIHLKFLLNIIREKIK